MDRNEALRIIGRLGTPDQIDEVAEDGTTPVLCRVASQILEGFGSPVLPEPTMLDTEFAFSFDG